ncbi:MAG TPA: ATP-binding protein [Chloroflexota bacterium]|jgi:signal transduction histidine kinase
MSRMFARIRWQLVAWTMLVVGTILLAVGLTVYLALSRGLVGQVDRTLALRADQAVENPRAILGGGGELERERYRGGVFYLIVGPDGQLLANPQHVDASGIDLARLVGAGRSAQTAEIGGEAARVYARPLPPAGPGSPPGRGPGPPGRAGPPLSARVPGATLIVGQSLAGEERALGVLLLILVAVVGVGLLLSFGGAWFLAGRALVPIQRAFRRQQQFVADASHELRTPLTVLRSATDLLDQHRDEPLAANGELFDDVRAEIARLQRLTGDLLTLARSDRDQLELAVAPLDLGALAGEVVRRIEPMARQRGVALSIRAGEPGRLVEADPDRLQQVLLILLDNAIKHTPSGGRVTVEVRADDGQASVVVADTGEGIAPEHLPRVFERFYRADAARSREAGGTGLGLAIAKSLIDAHGGSLTLASAPGAGTRATIRLPTAPHAASLASRLGGLAARITQGKAG